MPNSTETAGTGIHLQKVFELLKGASGTPAVYHVADYQRGYRWTPQQVTQLLDDLWEFFQKSGRDEKAFYCLQPLVIKTRADRVEVVDGQQRLTTILLILNYFNQRLVEEERQPLYSITFDTRSGFDQFLAKPNAEAAGRNVDFFHLFHATEAIKEWFKERRTFARDIESTLLNRTRVIWFELPESDDPVRAFTRLNAGKIPLSDDELIRALFLRRAETNSLEAEAIQLRIAGEWDLIEKALQRDEFWYFLTNDPAVEHNRIRFLFKLIAEGDGLDLRSRPDAHALFYHFHGRILAGAKAEHEWLRIKEEFMRLEEWFEDRVLFHLIGYLVHVGVPIAELRRLAQGVSKSAFDRALRRRIFEVAIGGTAPAQFTFSETGQLVEEHLGSLEYGTSASRRDILATLLLFNLATLIQSPRSNVRFQFDSFKKQEWNIEHVRSIASDPPEAQAEKIDWLELCRDHLDSAAPETPALRADIESYLSRPRQGFDLDFPLLYGRVLQQFGEAADGEAIHGIGNLALLDAGTNKSYKNAPFAVKRKHLIGLDQSGTFIPLCTRNVFLKCYTPKVENVMFWREDDRKAYQDAIRDGLVHFFTANAEGSL